MAQSKPDETPMMRQFYSLKEKHPDAVLLFRCGDFYETYAQDAVEAAEILGITLTRRNNGKNGAMALEMAGFPHHALDVYLPNILLVINAGSSLMVMTAASPGRPLNMRAFPLSVYSSAGPRLGKRPSFGNCACIATSPTLKLLLSYNLILDPLNETKIKLLLCS